jgi:hypothetical protein
MAIIISYKGSPYGMACAACKQLMIAPNWSEYVGENQVRHFCCCEDCGNRLERLVDLRMELIPKPSSYVEALVSLVVSIRRDQGEEGEAVFKMEHKRSGS